MLQWFPKAVTEQVAGASDAPIATSRFFTPERIIIACAITLSIVVIGSAAFIAYSLHGRFLSENERSLTNSSLIIAKQIEQSFAAVGVVEEGFSEDIIRLTKGGRKTFQQQFRTYDMHLKLRDKAAGLPYVGALMIYDAGGKLINYSRGWPIPEISIVDRDYFNFAKA